MRSIQSALLVIVFVLGALFVFDLYKNISYPLLWNDEAEAVMHGKRVLEYGYPKVSDGKNVVYPILHENKKLAIDTVNDAYIGNAWAMFYYATIGIALAEDAKDLYVKTALLRIPFATIGLIGLILIGVTFLPLFKDRKDKLLFLSIYILLLLMVVSIVLHIREARYYGLVVFVGGLQFFLYIRQTFLKPMNFWVYAVLMTLSLWLMFNTFTPVFYMSVAGYGIFEAIRFLQGLAKKDGISAGKKMVQFLKHIAPLILALLAILPLLSYFQTFKVSSETAQQYQYDFSTYLEHFTHVFIYFSSFDYLILALLIKGILIYLSIAHPREGKEDSIGKVIEVSNMLGIFFLVYFLMVPLIPHHIYTRYYLILLPLLGAMIALDVVSITAWLATMTERVRKKRATLLYSLIVIGFLGTTIPKWDSISGRVAEMFNQFEGPVDYVVKFVRESYPNPAELVLATNYEECSYMYYLDCKVTMGYVYNNLEEDLQTTPDIVLFREKWWHDPEPFNNFISKHEHKAIAFNIYDYPFNNIPELNLDYPHQFETMLPKNTEEKLILYAKVPPYDPSKDRLATLNYVIQENPENVLNLYERGNILLKTGKYESALADYGRALAVNPDIAEVYVARGFALYKQQEYRKALLDFDMAISLNSSSFEGHFNRGLSYFQLKDYQNALRDFEACTELNPNYPNAWFQRSVSNYMLKRYPKALEEAHTAIEKGFQMDQNYLRTLEQRAKGS